MAKAVNEPAIYTLLEPITVTKKDADGVENSEEISVFKIKPPRAGDMRVIDGHPGEMAQSVALIAQLSGYPISVIDRLSLADFVNLGDLVKGFLPAGLRNGGN